MAERNICLTNDSFPPVIDGVANAVTNYARVIEKDYGSATVVTPYYPDADDSAIPASTLRSWSATAPAIRFRRRSCSGWRKSILT